MVAIPNLLGMILMLLIKVNYAAIRLYRRCRAFFSGCAGFAARASGCPSIVQVLTALLLDAVRGASCCAPPRRVSGFCGHQAG